MKTSLIVLLSAFMLHASLLNAQSIDWSQIDGNASPRIEGQLNGLNMGGYTYGAISQQGSEVSILDECIQCVDFDCSPLLNQSLITGKEYNSTNPKELFTEKSRELRPSVLRFPGGTHSGWYHFYKYEDDGFYDAANPSIAKGYGMTINETIHLPNPYSYCQEDTRLTIDANYIETFTNYVQELKKDQADDYQLSVSYVANILAHFKFPSFGLPLIGSCTSTCGRGLSLQPMQNYNCQEGLNISYEGNEDLFDDDPAVYRFELYYKETQDAIEFLVNNLELGPDDELFVELGNEYYFNDGFNSGYSYDKYGMSASRYGHLAEIYSERLKCYFEDKCIVKTAIVSNPNTNWQTTTNIFKPNYPGLANLLDEDVTGNGQSLNDVIDAVVLHDYYNSIDCANIDDIQESFDCARESFAEHVYGEEGVIKDLDNFRNNFPGKSIWLTEWNIVAGNGATNLDYINTALHASFVQEYMLSLHDYNASNENIIELAHHHRIGYDLPWSVIQIVDGENDVAIERASAAPIKYLSNIQGGESGYFHGNILFENGSQYDKSKATVYAVSKENNFEQIDEVVLYYTNKTDQEIDFALPAELNNIEVISATNSYTGGDHLFSYGPSNGTHGRNRFHSGNTSSLYDEELNNIGFGTLHNSLQTHNAEDVNLAQELTLQSNSTGIFKILLKTAIDVQESPFSADQVILSPNPFNEYVTIKLASKQKVRAIDIFNQNGQLVESFPEVDVIESFDTSKLLPGIYWCRIATSEGIVYKKGIKL